MIRYLHNHQIDRDEWDTCIKASMPGLPYAYSWYLDIMAPGWCALVDHDYQTVFPLPTRRRLGVKYIFIPPFMQCLGLFPKEQVKIGDAGEFLGFIPDIYRFIDLSIINNPGNCPGRITVRDNYRLSLEIDYNTIRENFSSDCRRNISKAAGEDQTIVSSVVPSEAINLFRNGSGRRIKGIRDKDYYRLDQLMNYASDNQRGSFLAIKSGGKLIYSLFYLLTPGQITLLFTATSDESREKRSGYLAIDHIIKQYAGKDLVLDFAGSSIPAIADFIRSFGARPTTYYRIYDNRLPWPVRALKE